MRSLPRRKLKKREYYITISLNEMDIFFDRIKDHKHRLIFQLMGLAGLRVAEVTGNKSEMDRRNFLINRKVNQLSEEEKEEFLFTKKGKERKYQLVELPGLQIRDINFPKKCLKILGKGKKPREVPMSEKLSNSIREYLAKYCKEKKPDDNLIDISRARVFQLAKKYGKQILNEPKLHPHAFRHSYGSILHDLGYDSITIAEIMGHSTTKMVDEVYIHVSHQRKDLVASSLDKKNFWQKWRDKQRQRRLKKYGDITLNTEKVFIGRKEELRKIQFLREGQSAVIYGEKGVGKSAIIEELIKREPGKYQNVKMHIKKEVLIGLIMDDEGIKEQDARDFRRKELNKEYSTLTNLLTHFPRLKRRLVFDNIKLSDGEKNNLRALRERTDVLLVTSKSSESDLLDIQIIVKELPEVDKNLIIGQMVHVMSKDENDKMVLVEKILRYANMDLKKSEFIIEQMANGLEIEEIVVSENDDDSDTISFAPVIFLGLAGLSFYTVAGALGSGFAIGFVAVILLRYTWSYFKPKSTMGRVAE